MIPLHIFIYISVIILREDLVDISIVGDRCIEMRNKLCKCKIICYVP